MASLKQKALSLCCALTLATTLTPAAAFAVEGEEGQLVTVELGTADDFDIKDAVVHSVEPGGLLATPFVLDGENVSGETEQLYDYICSEMMKHSASIDVSKYNLTVAEVEEVVNLARCNPELWWGGTAYAYSYYPDDRYTGKDDWVNCRAASVAPQYLFTAAEAAKVKPEIEANIQAALAWADQADSAFGKAQALHDFLVRTCEYSPTVAANPETDGDPINYSAAGALSGNKTVVCQGYSLAYKLLLKRAGIDAIYVTSDEMDHGWNMVKLGGAWYHVDVTWDDPVGGAPDPVSHKYFLKSDTSFQEIVKKHHDWSAAFEAKSDYSYVDGDLPVFNCASCGHVADAPHKENVKPASCVAKGSYTEIENCIVCKNQIGAKNIETAALGHAYGAYVSNKDAKVGVDGTKTATCSRCGGKDTKVDAGSALKPAASKPGTSASAGKPGAAAGASSPGAAAVKAPVLKKLGKPTVKSSKKKQLTVSWKKGAAVTWNKVKYAPTAYVVQYSTDAKFKKGVKKTTVKVTKALAKKSKLTTTLKKGLVSKKNYYVRIAAQYKIGGKTYTTPYVVSKKVKVK